MTTTVAMRDLVDALEFLSAGGAIYEHRAVLSRERGTVYWISDSDVMDEEELSEDIDDGSLYLAIPHKNELDLGRDLVLRFAHEQLPHSYQMIEGFFHRKGAYSRFKDHLAKKDLLEAWYLFEQEESERALREWAEQNGVEITSDIGPGRAG